ncbi:hypothetical protein PXH59_00010 (plasmid) [Xenorhabdus sp. SF857]|nr:hypothetical protein [Xenorhabdus sp. SF857]WFQ78067.1 hypothetical protein PXH59_00010 [Xenorhabdus sp. SF857]
MTLDMLIQAFVKGERIKVKPMKGKDFKKLLVQLKKLRNVSHG